MAISEEILIKVNAVEAANSVKELRKALADARKAMAEAEIGSDDFKVATEAVEKAQRQLANVTRVGAKEVSSADQSYNALSRRLSELKAAYKDAQTAAQRADLAPQIREINDSLKQMDAEVGVFSRNVGDYYNQITHFLLGSLPPIFQGATVAVQQLSGAVGVVKGNVAEAVTQMSSATTVVGKMSGAFKVLKVAIASTGIGLLVVAIGSLYTWLQRSQEGLEFFNRAMSVIGATVDVVLDRISDLGGAVFKLLQGDWKGAWAQAKTAVQGVGEEIANDVKQADKLSQHLMSIEKREASLQARRASEKVLMEELRTIANDTNRSYEERIEAQERANAIALRTASDQRKLGAERIANLLGEVEVTERVAEVLRQLGSGADADSIIDQLGLSHSTIEDFKELVAVYESYMGKVQEFTSMQKEGVAKVNTLRKEQEALKNEVKETTTAIDFEMESLEQLEAERFDIMREARQKFLEDEAVFYDDLLKLDEEHAEDVAKLNEKKRKDDELTAKNKERNMQGSLQLASSIGGMLQNLADGESKHGKRLAIAGSTIETISGAVSAYMNAQKTGLPPWISIPLGITSAATVLAAGMANIAQIKSTDATGGSVSMGGNSIRTAPPAVVQQVPVTRSLTGASEEATLNGILNNTSATASASSQPMRAYVVLSDVEGKQKYANQTASEASF